MKPYSLFFLFLFLIPSTLMAQLEQHRWKDRVILLFASSAQQIDYQKQLADLQKDKAGLIDRDLIIYPILAQSDHKLKDLPAISTEKLQKQYNPQNSDFKIILIGKDGGVKARQNSPIPKVELFALIDGMPMRRAEIRRKNGTY